MFGNSDEENEKLYTTRIHSGMIKAAVPTGTQWLYWVIKRICAKK
jgi:hypothetical protein